MLVLTLYTTIYTTIKRVVTRHVISRYRVTSEYVTQLDVDYYWDDKLVTRISYPTRYLRSVNTVLVGVETKFERPEETQPYEILPIETPRRGGRIEPEPTPIHVMI
jgi:hypothetical protein